MIEKGFTDTGNSAPERVSSMPRCKFAYNLILNIFCISRLENETYVSLGSLWLKSTRIVIYELSLVQYEQELAHPQSLSTHTF